MGGVHRKILMWPRETVATATASAAPSLIPLVQQAATQLMERKARLENGPKHPFAATSGHFGRSGAEEMVRAYKDWRTY